MLVFAHVRPPEQRWFSFACLEDLGRRRPCPEPARPDAALLWWEERWWLSLPAGAEQTAARLSEFGRSEAGRPHLGASLAEHGGWFFPLTPSAAC